MTGTVVVRNADWLVAYDSVRDGHVYLRNTDLNTKPQRAAPSLYSPELSI